MQGCKRRRSVYTALVCAANRRRTTHRFVCLLPLFLAAGKCQAWQTRAKWLPFVWFFFLSPWEVYLIECTICTPCIDRPLLRNGEKLEHACVQDCLFFYVCVCVCFHLYALMSNQSATAEISQGNWMVLFCPGTCQLRRTCPHSRINCCFWLHLVCRLFGGTRASMGGEFNTSINHNIYKWCGGLCGSVREEMC